MDTKVFSYCVEAEIPVSRELRLTLPREMPLGPVQVLITSTAKQDGQNETLGALLRSEFFGIWRDREDIADSMRFARQLRRRAWSRAKR